MSSDRLAAAFRTVVCGANGIVRLMETSLLNYVLADDDWRDLASELYARASPPRRLGWSLLDSVFGSSGRSVPTDVYSAAFAEWYEMSDYLLKKFDPLAAKRKPSLAQVFAAPCLLYFAASGAYADWAPDDELAASVRPLLSSIGRAMRFVEQADFNGPLVMNFANNLQWVMQRGFEEEGSGIRVLIRGEIKDVSPSCLIGRMAPYADGVQDRPIPLRPPIVPLLYYVADGGDVANGVPLDAWHREDWFYSVAHAFGYYTVFTDDPRGAARQDLLKRVFSGSYIALLTRISDTDPAPGMVAITESVVEGALGPFDDILDQLVRTSEGGTSESRTTADYWIGYILASAPSPSVLDRALPPALKVKSVWVSFMFNALNNFSMNPVGVAMRRFESIYKTIKTVLGFDLAKTSMRAIFPYGGKATAVDWIGTVGQRTAPHDLPVDVYTAMFEFVIRRGCSPTPSPAWYDRWHANARTALAGLKSRFATSVAAALDDLFVGH